MKFGRSRIETMPGVVSQTAGIAFTTRMAVPVMPAVLWSPCAPHCPSTTARREAGSMNHSFRVSFAASLAQPKRANYMAGKARGGEACPTNPFASSSGRRVTSVRGLVHLAGFGPARVARLEAARHEGNASLYVSESSRALRRTGSCSPCRRSHRIDSVRTQEIFCYADHPVAFTLFSRSATSRASPSSGSSPSLRISRCSS